MRAYSMSTSQSLGASDGIGHACQHQGDDIEVLINHFADFARELPAGDFMQVFLIALDVEGDGIDGEEDQLEPYVNEKRLEELREEHVILPPPSRASEEGMRGEMWLEYLREGAGS